MEMTCLSPSKVHLVSSIAASLNSSDQTIFMAEEGGLAHKAAVVKQSARKCFMEIIYRP
jgi:hypothetical protein